MPAEAAAVTDTAFQCICDGTEFEGPTCNRGIVTTPTIPTLLENEMSMFNVSARPSEDIEVRLQGRGLQIEPTQITLNSQRTSATFQVSGQTAGHYTLRYSLLGAISSNFEMPDSSPVLVSMNRSAELVNRYFRYQGTGPGLIKESCCTTDALEYQECPMSTTAVNFRSSCKWSSEKFSHETSGVVFAEYRSLLLPLSISGINIRYDRSGEISSSLSLQPLSSCATCKLNQFAILGPKPLKRPDCYFHHFDSGDVEDLLRSNSLAHTYMDRLTPLLPTWFSASVHTSETGSGSFNDIDFATSLVEQDYVAGISGCESIAAGRAGLYNVLRYQRGFNMSVDEGLVSYNPSAETDRTPVCVAVNLCEDMDTTVYFGLPSSIQGAVRGLPALAPYDRDGWQYRIDSLSLHNQTREVNIPDMFWNGTEFYSPDAFDSDFRMKTAAVFNFESVQNGHVSAKVDYQGDVTSYFESGQVSFSHSVGMFGLTFKFALFRDEVCILKETLCSPWS